MFRGEMHALFIRCRNLDDPKTNGIIKRFLKLLVPEMGVQMSDEMAVKFRSIFTEWRHVLWTRITTLFEDLQKRVER